ncbi:MAG: hypothetical protein R3E97_02130 [Candidatus Eisenbacteria bacterium]
MRLGLAPAIALSCIVPFLGLSPSVSTASPDGDIDDTDWHVDLSPYLVVLPEREVARFCPGQRLGCGEAVVRAAISVRDEKHLYRFHAEKGQLLTLGTDEENATYPIDTVLELLSDDCGAILASDDDSGPAAYSLISRFEAPYTGTYIARVRGFNPVLRGTYSIYLACEDAPTPPVDDDCGGVLQVITCGHGVLSGETARYRNDYDPFGAGGGCVQKQADGRDVAVAMDLEEGDIVHLSYESSADGSLYILAGCGSEAGCQVGVDDKGIGEVERIPYWVAPETGRHYLILDSAGAESFGTWTLEYEILCRQDTAVCCTADGRCVLMTVDACERDGGTFLANETTCDPSPCAPSPVQESSWGGIKSRYR